MKKILAMLICFSMLLTLVPLVAFADEDDDPNSEPVTEYEYVYEESRGVYDEEEDPEYGDDPTEVEDLYAGGRTIYDFENEVDKPTENDEEEPDDEEFDPDDDVYTDFSYDAENARELSHDPIPNEYIVTFVEPWEVPGKEKQLQHEIDKFNKIGAIDELGAYVIRIDDLQMNPNGALNRLKNNKYIKAIEPHYTMEVGLVPTDPDYRFFQNAAMNLLNAPAGWDIIKGYNDVTIAVIDSGVAPNPDLPKLHSGYSASAGLSFTNDKHNHGTGVAGVIGAIGGNGIGGVGINWSASIMAVKVDDASGVIPIANVANGIIWAANNGAKIINLSLGTSADSAVLKNAIDYAYGKGCAIFAATGNGGFTSVDYPARYPNVMAVGSSTGAGRAPTSNYGGGIDVLGLGSFFTTQTTGISANSSGTSYATPQVAGLASLIWGVNPKLTNAQVYDLIRSGAGETGRFVNNEIGHGLINIGRTLELALATVTPAAPPATPTPQQPTPTTPENPAPPPETSQETRTPPVITLVGFENLTLDYGQSYVESGYSAVDCKGLPLTVRVTGASTVDHWKAGIYTITYDTVDAFGLTAQTTRSVTVSPKPADPPPKEAPKITINGSSTIILHRDSNTPYTEQSARAIDHDGKNISDQVIVTGWSEANRREAKIHTLTYTVTSPDTGLTATATRNVRIVSPTERRDPRTSYGLSGQAKQGAKVTHTGVVSSALGLMDLKVSSIDKNMTISVQLVDASSKSVVFTDRFSAAGTKQYRIDQGRYELVVNVDQANGNSKYTIDLLMPEAAPVLFYDVAEVPLLALPRISPIGSNPIILHLGGSDYVEQGANAIDYLGNDISASVVIDGEPNLEVPGTYVITYTVTGTAGVPVSVTRDVRIVSPNEFGFFDEAEVPLPEWDLMGNTVPEGMMTYTVVRGDSLWRISMKHYGTGSRWGEIYELNKSIIGKDPRMIQIGMVLTIRQS